MKCDVTNCNAYDETESNNCDSLNEVASCGVRLDNQQTKIDNLKKELAIRDRALEMASEALEKMCGFCHECHETTGIDCDVSDPAPCYDEIKNSFITKATQELEGESG